MKVLAIMGSPRKEGTGTKALKEIESRLATHGPVQLEVLRLKDVNLGQCRGCFQCISRGEQLCPMRKELVAIEEKIEAADGVILVSPGYVQNVSGLMKNFMDRIAYTNHRPRFFGKKVMIVANGGSGLAKTLDALRIAIGGPEVVSELEYTQLPWPIQERSIVKRQANLEKAVDRFYKALQVKDMRPSFNNYMRFLFSKGTTVETKEWLPADHEFYRDLDRYYYDVDVGMGMRIKASLLMPVAKFFMRGMAPPKDGADGSDR
ncbi:MAG: NAD(P)H-dependent oxidoreductase, partial [Methanomassiliicoccales archaeon]|nr:NAD(P)H-dependent oxidoreductase [Methanomassiliicoccales archaeon]